METFRRYLSSDFRTVVFAAGIGLVALGGGVTYGLATAGSTPAPQSHPAAVLAAPPKSTPSSIAAVSGHRSKKTHPSAKQHALRATITAVSTGRWTVTSKKGGTIFVVITPSTKFGTKKAPGTAASYPVGTAVAISGPLVGDQITALRVHAAKNPGQ